MNRQFVNNGVSGYGALLVMAVLQLGLPLMVVLELNSMVGSGPAWPQVALAIFGVIGTVLVALGWRFCFFTVHPNEAKVLQLFGRYAGTAVEPGLRFANPFYAKRPISVRIRNFESGKLKVNESGGSPIEIAAIVVWQVVDTAEAAFEVDNFEGFVTIQSEAAVRNLAMAYPYESSDEGQLALRSDPAAIAEALRNEIQARVEKAGVKIIEARISHLAYAPEIAAAMLRRQQAAAVIAARRQIVEGAVGIVQTALEGLERESIIELDGERRAAMISNLLVVLCSEQQTQPVVNTGTLYN